MRRLQEQPSTLRKGRTEQIAQLNTIQQDEATFQLRTMLEILELQSFVDFIDGRRFSAHGRHHQPPVAHALSL